MLEKPDIPDESIIACLQAEYGLPAAQITFLPLGADRNTAVYRVITDSATAYFVKLRSGPFDEITILTPKLLHDQGITQIIAPLSTRSQQLWANLDQYAVTVSPFVEGRSGFEVDLSDHHWVEFGRVLKGIHSAVLPSDFITRIPRETYSSQWREIVRDFQQRVEKTRPDDPISAKLAALLKMKRHVIDTLVARAERLAQALQASGRDFILCHADIHAGNILIDTTGALYIVDWDTLILAPRERDLMFVGGGLGGGGHTAEEEETLFYRGYGQTQVDPVALAYYRYERIVQDIATYCEEILLLDKGDQDRAEGLRQLTSQFDPNNVVEMAYRSEKSLPEELRSASV